MDVTIRHISSIRFRGEYVPGRTRVDPVGRVVNEGILIETVDSVTPRGRRLVGARLRMRVLSLEGFLLS